ncbi:hypothetical protein U8P75_14035 [Rhizobium beringeri]|nr:hypothetical protein U8P75_14035 [Rhizobium beringeri]
MEQQLSEIIGAIYDCVAREDAWPNALRLINGQVNGFLTTLAVFDTTTRSARLAQIACDDGEAIRTSSRMRRTSRSSTFSTEWRSISRIRWSGCFPSMDPMAKPSGRAVRYTRTFMPGMGF